MNANASLLDRAGLDKVRVGKLIDRGLEGADDGELFLEYNQSEALGWDDFGNDDFEEIMSTHYGRMVVLDDRVLLFANPEDAAEYIGFDLTVK